MCVCVCIRLRIHTYIHIYIYIIYIYIYNSHIYCYDVIALTVAIAYFCFEQITKYLDEISYHSSTHAHNVVKAYGIADEVHIQCIG